MEPPSPELPPELRAFLHSCIDAIEQVEILMLLRPDRELTVREVAASLGLTEPGSRDHLETLSARGLLAVRIGAETRYRYAPKSPDLVRYGSLLAQYHASSRSAIFSFVSTRGRRSLKRFSDAFKLRDPE